MDFASRFLEFLETNGISYTETKRSVITDCPSCTKEGHFYIYKTTGYGTCFKCGHQDGWKGIISKLINCSYQEAQDIIYGKGAGDDVVREAALPHNLFDKKSEEANKTQKTQITLGPDFAPVHKSQQGMEYLASRGITDLNLINQFDLRYHKEMNAVVFPIRQNGKYYGWQARKIPPIPENSPRLLTMEGFNKADFLLNYDLSKSSSLTIVEGPFDCIKAHSDEFPAVASLGKVISNTQILLIKQAGIKRLYIGLDEDAYKEVYDLIHKLCWDIELFRVWIDGGKDFGDLSKEEAKSVIKKATQVESPIGILGVYLNSPLEKMIKNGG